ncbi:hypothetical protein ACFVRD_25005 [Streptomyces sp. NPDC057908]|uniref:hypothetical protein n=1 Tax=Streptomyces sp. NPDC057908 TaxID=3346276 RepID=UPI0036ED2DC9
MTYGKPVGAEAGVDYSGSLPIVTDPSSGSCLSTSSQTTSQGQQVTVTGNASAAAVSPTAQLNRDRTRPDPTSRLIPRTP